MTHPLVKISDLQVEYWGLTGDVHAVRGVSLDIGRGEILGLAGESGSGKSTIGKSLMRILEAPGVITDGQIEFDGQNILTMTEETLSGFRWRTASMVFQSALNALNPVLTLREQLEDTMRAHGVEGDVGNRCRELLALVDIDGDRIDAYPHQLSGGMRQRVCIAMALCLEPELVIMDEPTTALDVIVQRDILARVKHLQRSLGFSVLFITHDLPLMLSFCDRIGILQGGQLREIGTAQRLRHEAQHPYTRSLMAAFPDLEAPSPADENSAPTENQTTAPAGDVERTPLLTVRALEKSYQTGGVFSSTRLKALKKVSFEMTAGEVVALVGQSGSGKSTVARQIARLEVPDAGDIFLNGESVSGKKGVGLDYRRRVQLIFQDPFGSLNPVHTIGHHVARPLLRHGRATASDVREKTLALLEEVGLTPAADYVDKHPHALSGGQRQRVAVARALAPEPELILADEPTSMLDVSIRMGVLKLLQSLSQRGIAILYITHDLASARFLASRIMVMKSGEIVESGNTESVLTAPKHPYTRALLDAVPHPDKAVGE